MSTIFLLIASHVSHKFSLFTLHFFLFALYLLNNFKCLIFYLTDSSFWSNPLLLLSHFFTSFPALLSSKISFSFLWFLSVSLYCLSFCILFSWFHCTIFLCFPVAHCFLKTAILNSSSDKSHISISWTLSLENYCDLCWCHVTLIFQIPLIFFCFFLFFNNF